MPLIIIVGEDRFSLKNKAQQLINEAQIDAFSTALYDASETPLDEALTDALTVPFMSDQKAVIIRQANFFSDAKDASIYKDSEHFKHLPTVDLDHVFLIFLVDGKKVLDKPALLKAVVDVAEVIRLEPKKPEDLKAWIDRQLAKAELRLAGPLKEVLYERMTHDPEVAYQEMKKLLLYTYETRTIDLETLEQLITPVLDEDVFKIINQMLEGKKEKAFKTIEALLSAKTDALGILTAMIHKFRELALTQAFLKEKINKDDLASTLKVSPGRAYYMIKNAQMVPASQVQQELERLSGYDQAIKTGQMDKNLALELFVLGH
jgi:DNA polymerase-3 subunit delta